MAASENDKRRLRRMISETTEDTYTDTDLAEYLERWPLVDSDGNAIDDEDWTATYDLHMAASEIWSEKASCAAVDFAFTADGASYSRNQVYEQYMKQSRHHLSRRAAGSVQPVVTPKPQLIDAWLGNAAEDTI